MSKQEFGAKLLALRKQKQVSQAEAASYLGLTVAAYQNYKAGRREAGYETISKLAVYYNVSTDYLLGREQSYQDTSIDTDKIETYLESIVDQVNLIKDALKK